MPRLSSGVCDKLSTRAIGLYTFVHVISFAPVAVGSCVEPAIMFEIIRTQQIGIPFLAVPSTSSSPTTAWICVGFVLLVARADHYRALEVLVFAPWGAVAKVYRWQLFAF